MNKPAFTHEESTFAARDNTPLYYQCYKSNAKNPVTIVLQHGIGEHSGRYSHLAEKLAPKGYHVYMCDARGFGNSPGIRGDIESFDRYVEDLIDFTAFVRTREKTEKVILYGHSMGGIIVSLAAYQIQNQLKAIVLSSPAFMVQMDLKTKIKKAIGDRLAAWFPSFRIKTGITGSMLTHDPEMMERTRKDPIVHGYISFRLGKELFLKGPESLQKAAELSVPVYLFHGLDDKIAMPEGSRAYYDKVSSVHKTIKLFPGLRHETINETPREREAVMEELLTWLSGLTAISEKAPKKQAAPKVKATAKTKKAAPAKPVTAAKKQTDTKKATGKSTKTKTK